MNSLSKKCQEAKEKYDSCFNKWFSEKYLKGKMDNECEELFKEYQKCIKEALRNFLNSNIFRPAFMIYLTKTV
ncbi:TP53-regulated inhibitor of apoptosis 1-like isoform X1 [Brachionus plicatilis]|uniref:TP53-regulated inhibitor of apoptosis 1-like isoform X1 n=1 Tax=Brachionus plicatilis TaxID=10195 RepID=A0A3M7SKR4_BRAPC|nr:TP53-regulated inhibitor of apoptosis 1-like isoform X1 [Brachionus plicatilis]